MDVGKLRQRCKERLRDLALPQPFDARSFCDLLAAQRNRSILLYPMTTDDGPCGLWIAGPSLDVIFYEQRTSPPHQEHIILHEVCHLLCEHHPVALPGDDISQLLCPHLDATMVHHVLQRSAYSTEEECEAELLASLILEQVTDVVPGRRGRLDAEAEGVLGRLEASLEQQTSR